MRSDFHAWNILSCLLSSYLVHRLIHFGPVLGLGQFWVGPVLGWASFGFGPVLGWASFVWASFGYGPVLGLGQFCLGQFWSGQLWGASYVSASSVLTPKKVQINSLWESAFGCQNETRCKRNKKQLKKIFKLSQAGWALKIRKKNIEMKKVAYFLKGGKLKLHPKFGHLMGWKNMQI